jgi:predicted MFS family arabinose efflux permease
VPEHAEPEPAGRAHDPDEGLRRYARILRGSHVWLLAPTWIAINATLGLFTSQTLFQLVREPKPQFADQTLMGGFEPWQMSVGLAVGGLLFFAGLLYWGGRFKDLRRTTIILYGIAGGAVLVLGGLLANHSAGLPGVILVAAVLLAGAGLFVLAGATPAALGLLADISERFPADRGAIMGLYSVFLAIGQIAGALIGGVAADWRGIDGMLLATFVLLGIALVPLSRLRKQEHEIDAGNPATESGMATA